MHVLVVDDEPPLRDALERVLVYEGYTVSTAVDGLEALAAVDRHRFDLVILDIGMPRLDGMTACARIRARGSAVPLLMLTARDAVTDRVAGLDAGADDYLVKPFSLDELLARVRALTRRAAKEKTPANELAFADLVLELDTYIVRRGDREIALTRTEFALLSCLLRRPRTVLTRAQLLETVWGFDAAMTSNALDVYIGYVRRKIEAAGEPRILHTVRGVGYTLREETRA